MKPSGPTCPQCGAALSPDAPQGLCPACLLAAGLAPATLASQPDAEATLDSSQSKPSSGGSQLKFTAAGPGLPQSIRYFGDYELDSEIARGGMGVVYRARQVSLNRTVALKMILAGQFVGETELQRFRAEAEAAANLNHPNIVPIYEIGLHEGRHYFSMKLVEGGSLADRMRNAERGTRRAGDLKSPSGPTKPTDGDCKSPAPFPRTERVALLAKVARAVHHAHQRGVLHRDLKPGNILLDEQGEPFVTDFGLAKRLDGGSDLTHTGATMGTPAYMAPEQAAGRVKELSTALDVYALGAIFFHLLTGRVPFIADTPLATMKLVMEKEAPSPRTLDATIDRDLETICLKCLEKDAKRRYGSAEALAEEFERWLRHEPIVGRPITNGERMVKWVRRKPAIAALGAAVAAAVVLGIAGIFWQWRAAEEARDVAQAARIEAETQRDAAEQARKNEVKQREKAELEAAVAELTLLSSQAWGTAEAYRSASLDMTRLAEQHRKFSTNAAYRAASEAVGRTGTNALLVSINMNRLVELRKTATHAENTLVKYPVDERVRNLACGILGTLARTCFEAREPEEVRQTAKKWLEANSDPKAWYHGDIVSEANQLLGQNELREGNAKAAGEYLLKAGQTTGSQVLKSFGPKFTLATELLAVNEREVVLQYLDLVEKFWVQETTGDANRDELSRLHDGLLKQWREEIRAGKTPNFRAGVPQADIEKEWDRLKIPEAMRKTMRK